MADYWKSQGRKFCDFCKCWIADNKPSIQFHEGGKKHKENVTKRLKEIHKTSAKQAKQQKKFNDDLKSMENAAMAAYLKDVQGNTSVDLTAQQIIRDKMKKNESLTISDNPNQMPEASPETNPRHKRPQDFPADIDYCDPTTFHRTRVRQRMSNPICGNSSENEIQGKAKITKDKKRGKNSLEGEQINRHLVQKLWYEAKTPEGYNYYWHIESNETTWEPPAEGFMSIVEQEEEAKEQALQAELLEQLDKEEAQEKANIMEEQRANAERERLRELRKSKKKNEHNERKSVGSTDDEADEEKIPYRRDYSVPDRVDPYGPWQTVEAVPRKVVDLQLPQQKEVIQVIKPQATEPQPRIFKEKTVTSISTGNSDDESGVVFKKRKFGNKNMRKRLNDD